MGVERLRGALGDLMTVAERQARHDDQGLCPDETEGHDRRDPECPVCRVLMAAEKVVKASHEEEMDEVSTLESFKPFERGGVWVASNRTREIVDFWSASELNARRVKSHAEAISVEIHFIREPVPMDHRVRYRCKNGSLKWTSLDTFRKWAEGARMVKRRRAQNGIE